MLTKSEERVAKCGIGLARERVDGNGFAAGFRRAGVIVLHQQSRS